MKPALHPLEDDRLRELRRYGILDTDKEREFDELVEIASEICEAPVSVINFIDEGRQWFKAEVGLGVRSTPLDTSLCGHAILQGDYIEIPDTLEDARMADNPLCTGDPGFRFYAGSVLKGGNGLPLGTVCLNLFPICACCVRDFAVPVFAENGPQSRRKPSRSGA